MYHDNYEMRIGKITNQVDLADRIKKYTLISPFSFERLALIYHERDRDRQKKRHSEQNVLTTALEWV